MSSIVAHQPYLHCVCVFFKGFFWVVAKAAIISNEEEDVGNIGDHPYQDLATAWFRV
jgi:hypothetical protein